MAAPASRAVIMGDRSCGFSHDECRETQLREEIGNAAAHEVASRELRYDRGANRVPREHGIPDTGPLGEGAEHIRIHQDRYIPFRIWYGSVARGIDEGDFAAFRQLPGEGVEVAGGHSYAVHENEGPGGHGRGAG